MNTEIINIPKKRGRRPKYLSLKIKEEEELKKKLNNLNNIIEEPIIKKKRGRKPKNIHIIKHNYNELQNNINIKDLLILFLPLNLDKLKNNITYKNTIDNDIFLNNSNNIDLLNYNTNINPFDSNINNNYMLLEHNELINSIDIDKQFEDTTNAELLENLNSNKDLIIPFRLKNKNTICYWDLHTYSDTNYTLPINDTKCIGNFCSLECAAAYNFNELNDNNVWERYSLLHCIYNINNKIKLAPSRILLNIFGGPMNIDQYRELFKNNNKNNNIHININVQPLTNINMQLEITNNKLNVNNNFIPLTNKRLNEAHFNLSKNIDVSKNINTLDKCINLINKLC